MNALLAALALATAAAGAGNVTERIETGPGDGAVLSHSIVAPVSRRIAWRTVSTVDGWKCWAVPAAWASPGDPLVWETAYRTDAKPGEASNIMQRFRVVRHGRELAFRTIKTPAGFQHSEALAQVETRFILRPVRGGTRIELRGEGYRQGEAGAALLGFFRHGNRVSMEALSAHLKKGGEMSCPK